jgi:hypothetical protein
MEETQTGILLLLCNLDVTQAARECKISGRSNKHENTVVLAVTHMGLGELSTTVHA